MNLQQIDRALDSFQNMNMQEKQKFFQNLFQVAEVQQAPVMNESQSVCPYTKESLRHPCSLKQCPFWINHSWTKNCAINFMTEQEKENLSVEQVSFLYKKSPDRVESIFKKCFKIVQRHYLKDFLKNKAVPQFNYIPGFCVSCQSKLSEEEFNDPLLRIDADFGYCSPECKKTFPVQYFEIEKFFEVDFFKVVEVGSEIFNFYYLEEVLGFQPNVLRNRLEKILNGEKEKRKKRG